MVISSGSDTVLKQNSYEDATFLQLLSPFQIPHLVQLWFCEVWILTQLLSLMPLQRLFLRESQKSLWIETWVILYQTRQTYMIFGGLCNSLPKSLKKQENCYMYRFSILCIRAKYKLTRVYSVLMATGTTQGCWSTVQYGKDTAPDC